MSIDIWKEANFLSLGGCWTQLQTSMRLVLTKLDDIQERLMKEKHQEWNFRGFLSSWATFFSFFEGDNLLFMKKKVMMIKMMINKMLGILENVFLFLDFSKVFLQT